MSLINENYCLVNHLQVELALDEMLRLQEEGPTEQDVSTVLEIEQRAHENGLQVNLTLKLVLFASQPFLCCQWNWIDTRQTYKFLYIPSQLFYPLNSLFLTFTCSFRKIITGWTGFYEAINQESILETLALVLRLVPITLSFCLYFPFQWIEMPSVMGINIFIFGFP